ncbi:MAG: hypothetical protein U0V18_01195 [Anaerolineales bacterium]
MKEPRVYKNSPILLVFIILLFMFFLGILLFAFGSNSIGFMIPLVAFSIFLFGAAFVSMASKTIVSDDEITVQGILGTKSINWVNVGRVSGWGYAMKLHSIDDDVTISISPRLPGYQEVIDFVGLKRPDLFTTQEYSSMKRGIVQYLLVGFGLLMMGGVAVAYMVAVMSNEETVTSSSFVPLLILAGFALIMVVTSLSGPQSINLEGNSVNLKYLFSEKSLQSNEIANVQLAFTQSRNGRHYFIALNLLERKTIRISGLGMSLPIAYLVLKNWHLGRSSGSGTQTNIAPNWSDNTWR